MSLKRLSFTVHGNVQGVFYRQFASEAAKSLSITGNIRNTSSGTVAGEAQGSHENLQKFVSELKKGSDASKVDKVEEKGMDVVEGENGFEVS